MYIRVHDGVNYNVQVDGDGEPVVFLHGFTGSSSSWKLIKQSLQAQYKIITIDLLGHGLTDAPSDSSRYAMENTTEDLNFICKQLELESIRLVGYSMGGRVALSFAIRYPKMVNKLILESSSPGLDLVDEREQRIKSDEQLAGYIEQKGIDWFAQYWSNITLFNSQKLLPDEIQQNINKERLKNSCLGLANSLRGLGTGRQPSYWNDLGQLSIPVTLIAGELDKKYVHIGEKMKEQFKLAQLHVVPEAGHNVHLEQPAAFLSLVTKALEQHINR